MKLPVVEGPGQLEGPADRPGGPEGQRMAYPDDLPAPAPQPDHDAIIAAMQDQLDDLTAAMTAQQAAIESLLARVTVLERRAGQPPGS